MSYQCVNCNNKLPVYKLLMGSNRPRICSRCKEINMIDGSQYRKYSMIIGASVGATGSFLGMFIFRSLELIPKIIMMMSASVFILILGMSLLAKNAKMVTTAKNQNQ